MNDIALGQQTLRKVAWRLIPFVCVLYLLNILDRANVGFARLQMQDDLRMSEDMFNRGYGIFYVGYLLFEVPSNLLLRRVGARRWIARIMISWGLVGLCIAQTGMMSILPIFWTLPTAFLTGAAAAGGIAMINSVANIGGYYGPTILGKYGLWSIAAILAFGAVLMMGLPAKSAQRQDE